MEMEILQACSKYTLHMTKRHSAHITATLCTRHSETVHDTATRTHLVLISLLSGKSLAN